MSKLLTPLKVGRLTLNQRMAMAPMTRLRADTSHLLLPSVKEYYQQRASVPGSLLIAEATVISPRHGGYSNVPGIFNDKQIASWKEITKAVHDKGSHIFLQLWALGRAANPGFMAQAGHELVSASDVPMKSMFGDEMHYPVPMTESGIQDAISDFAAASEKAMTAGFDGVEIHGANGYLIDQFLQDVSNKRTDKWGGSVENRSRLAVEVTNSVVKAIGNDRTAIRLSPWSQYQGMRMEDPVSQFSDVAQRLAELKLAYLHVCESEGEPKETIDWLLQAYGDASPILVAGGYDGESARKAVDITYKDYDVAVSFGRPYISNPDLVFRVKHGLPLASLDPATMYGQMSEGYIDYPFSEQFQAETPV
ncbi:FMN-linked oxidoreductase [Penicillium nucicola]|uniref:FMN-linked oxidoreductase n=1 Tax=Penicillium nucicola TaxID=1850975 RepID=UPI002545375B|nr:FMN-linked oxidoreductase [Penicillium nucicola]KAJ5770057.1 FMN-linked oxidoreductase [Penicillium nucicola]